jgi:hypothetical protein
MSFPSNRRSCRRLPAHVKETIGVTLFFFGVAV